MGTELNGDTGNPAETLAPELVAIQQSLLAEDLVVSAALSSLEPVSEAEVEPPQSVPPEIDPASDASISPGSDQLVLPGVVDETEAGPPTIAGFEAERVPLRSIAWPFVLYDIVWAVFALTLGQQLLELPDGTAAYDWAYYEYALWIGVGLTAVGPLLIVVVWLVTKLRNRDSNGVGISTLLVGSAATLFGVALWWGALILVDYLRLGSVF